ncbi:MAG: hypothetical protein AB7S48_03590 [Bacteroidales bacterium]
MKRLILLIIVCSTTSISIGQNSIQAFLDNYKASDTIAINDFLNIQSLSISNSDYTIAGYQLNIMDRGFLKEFKSDSDKITDEMRDAIENLKGKNIKTTKIFFEDIKVKTPVGKIKNIGGLLHIIKIE